ncbi:S8 family serine peptidase [Nonomuraea sp. NPDC059194]|uniref:S8 family peptidase n=1 Tax=Nonomuraea sp. NPDC059194 TaxID=3346764 RepID=UPI0036CAFBD5
MTLPLASCASAPPPRPASSPGADYLVFYAAGGKDKALAAIEAGGGRTVSTEPRLGYVVAHGVADSFLDTLGDDEAIVGISTDRPIGFTSAAARQKWAALHPEWAAGRTITALPALHPEWAAGRTATALPARTSATLPDTGPGKDGAPGTKAREPLASRQWDMKMIGADRANTVAPGDRKVLVGVIDTGIDGKHPDIAANFNRKLSRNFVTDRPKDPSGQPLDGPCEVKSCKDPADVDDEGHGTHVASTIAAPINGRGIAGVAPNVQVVNLRSGQDSGMFFLKPSLDALTYAADNGIDVVNMSFYIDPWLFNCTNNKADTPRQRLEQRGIITGMQRALDYARGKGVTLIAALGNGSIDLGDPRTDEASPNYPRNKAHSRTIDNSCLNVPAESDGVISIAALGPSGRKALYSDYGIEQTDLSAPGGDTLDGGGVSHTRSILAAAPKAVLRAENKIDAAGKPKTSEVVRDCHRGECAYYQYLDGTSMAAPHATGVAAILISRFGRPGPGGVALAPASVERLMYSSATQKACPTPRTYVYRYFGQEEKQTCVGDTAKNGFYGRGVVNAYKAATVAP